jgi:hypothetical protein
MMNDELAGIWKWRKPQTPLGLLVTRPSSELSTLGVNTYERVSLPCMKVHSMSGMTEVLCVHELFSVVSAFTILGNILRA